MLTDATTPKDDLPAPNFDHELEANVLGWVTSEPEKIDYKPIYDLLRAEHFSLHPHRVIWSEIQAMLEAGEPVDFFTLKARLQEKALMGYGPEFEVDQLEYGLMQSRAEHVGHLSAHVALIIKYWRKRRYLEVSGSLAAAAQEGREDLIPVLMQRLEDVRAEGADDGREKRHKREPLRLLSDEECEQMPPSRGIIGDILYEDSIAFLYAKAGRWKTFLALSWALSCATGRQWLGRHVIDGPVVYIAAEGARGIGKRIRAWKRHHGIKDSAPIKVMPVPVQLLDASQVRALIALIEQQVGVPVLIVIDTLARSMAGGNENDTKDINTVTDAAYAIRAAFECCVLILHHTGKDDARGMRGSSALGSNADTVMRLVSTNEQEPLIKPGQPITLRSEKPKDFDPFEDICLTTQIVKWASNDGTNLSSLVIVQGDPSAAQQASLSAQQQKVLDALYVAGTGLRAGNWEKAAAIPQRSFYDARDFLVGHGYVTEAAKVYTISEAGVERVSETLRPHCDDTAEDENRTAEVFDEGDSENPDFIGVSSTAVLRPHIYRRSTAVNGHRAEADVLAARVQRYAAQGMNLKQAQEQALADIGKAV